jgi:D-glycero-alpha-D-manno-heptose-7-phosphate kinase
MMGKIPPMNSIYLPVRDILKQVPIETSAPCRIDSGGTWDIKAMALPLERIEPVTVNMALSLRTRVILSSFQDGWIKITSDGFVQGEEYGIKNLPLNSPFGIFFAAVNHFGFHGLKVNIRSDSPIKSALGGSSTALVALIKALAQLKKKINGEKSLSNKRILHLGYHMEDGISGGNCGIQDQAAAVYGGVNRWIWSFGNEGSLLKRDILLDRKGQKEISDCILVAYSGESHVSAAINRSWIYNFLEGQTRAGWIEANDIVKELAKAIKKREWKKASDRLKDEMAIRRKITPDALIPVTEKLIDSAENMGCGARFTGAGAGGSVWAIGEPDRIGKLRTVWDSVLAPIRGATVLDCTVDPIGVR